MNKNAVQWPTILFWLLRLVIVGILWQTLWFKFTGHAESVAIFSKLHVEPWGRVATGVAELIAGLLLLWNATARMGALLAFGIMAGAILSHLFVLGIESAGDGGQLFILACIVLLLAGIVLLLYKPVGTRS